MIQTIDRYSIKINIFYNSVKKPKIFNYYERHWRDLLEPSKAKTGKKRYITLIGDSQNTFI